jgi:hypothetical protein
MEPQEEDIDGIPIPIDESAPISLVKKTHEMITQSLEEDIDGVPIPATHVSYEEENLDGVPL